MDQNLLVIFSIIVLTMICFGAVGFAFLGAKKEKSNKRMERVARGAGHGKREKKDADASSDGSHSRRRDVQDTLKELEAKQKAQKERLTIRLRLQRAGMKITPRTFYIASGCVGVVVIPVALVLGAPVILAAMMGFVAGFGVPRWFVNFKTSRRQAKFTEEFASSLDVIVRGVKSGLPINDCLQIVAKESSEPVRTEFADLVDGQAMGVTIEQGLHRVYDRMPLAEVNFFMIVLAIQQKTGGNLSEALGNLANVLRDRKKMRAKIQAMSQEAKASAGIIGVLPPGVMLLIYLTTPEYMNLLFTTTTGNMIILGGITWMGIGILVMRKMINFNF